MVVVDAAVGAGMTGHGSPSMGPGPRQGGLCERVLRPSHQHAHEGIPSHDGRWPSMEPWIPSRCHESVAESSCSDADQGHSRHEVAAIWEIPGKGYSEPQRRALAEGSGGPDPQNGSGACGVCGPQAEGSVAAQYTEPLVRFGARVLEQP